jgi:hypothetical protein
MLVRQLRVLIQNPLDGEAPRKQIQHTRDPNAASPLPRSLLSNGKVARWRMVSDIVAKYGQRF